VQPLTVRPKPASVPEPLSKPAVRAPIIEISDNESEDHVQVKLENSPVPERPEPTTEPAAQAKANARVFKADVNRELLQDEVNERKFLESLLGNLGVDEDRLRRITKRVTKLGDSLDNATRAEGLRKAYLRG
jgi:hypothetical protein